MEYKIYNKEGKRLHDLTLKEYDDLVKASELDGAEWSCNDSVYSAHGIFLIKDCYKPNNLNSNVVRIRVPIKLKPKAGDIVRLRNGSVVGPLIEDATFLIYHLHIMHLNFHLSWDLNGFARSRDEPNENDIVEILEVKTKTT